MTYSQLFRYVKKYPVLSRWNRFRTSLRNRIDRGRIVRYIDRRPFVSFFIALGVLFLFILLGNILANLSKSEVTKPNTVKDASIYRIGSAPRITLQGQVDKSGVFKIVAQTPGIVNSVDVQEGETVTPGHAIVTLASNYQGGNIPGLQAQLAQKQYQNILDTYDIQKSLLDDQRTVATASAQNADKLRDISQQNLNDTNSLIDLNNDILTTLNTQLQTLQNSNTQGVNDPQILQTRQLIAQLRGGLNQLQASARGLSLQTDQNNPPTLLSNTQKDIALKQLDIQQKALDLNRDVSRIQAAVAGVAASLMNPTSPCNGVVDRIFVHPGDSVTPGTVLAIVSGSNQTSTIIVRAPNDIAAQVSHTDTSVVHLGNMTFDAVPTYVSQEATDGQLYTIVYAVPDATADLTNNDYVSVDMPLGYADTSSANPFIPLDAIYQTQNEAYVLVADHTKAVSRKVTLGVVYGRFVQILSGLRDHDQVILNRNILSGDSVKTVY